MYHEETPLLAGPAKVIEDFGALIGRARGEDGEIDGGDGVVGVVLVSLVARVCGVAVLRRDRADGLG